MNLLQEFESDLNSDSQQSITSLKSPFQTLGNENEENNYNDVSHLFSRGIKVQDTVKNDIEFVENVDSNATSGSCDNTKSEILKNKRKSRQLKRNSGQEYTSYSGKLVNKKSVTVLSKCKRDCKSKVSHEDQLRNFQSHYSEGTYKRRCESLASLVQISHKKTSSGPGKKIRKYSVKYFLTTETGQVEVCQKCFVDTIAETKAFIYSVCNRIATSKCITTDLRGKTAPKNKTSEENKKEIREHIKQILSDENHYSRSYSAEKGFSANVDLTKMYKKYCEETLAPVSKKIYKQVYKEYMMENT